jgi:toxin-antitoxin system PIN domain toxin
VFVVDTNILLYAANRRSPYHLPSASAWEEWRSGSEAWLVTWSVVYEFLRSATHPRTYDRPLTFEEAWSFIETLRISPSFGILVETDRHAEVVRDLTHEYPRMSGNRMHDLHIAAVMHERGIVEIRTADRDFQEFKFLRVVNPL